MSFTVILMMLCLLLVISGIILLVRGFRKRSAKYIVSAVLFLMAPGGIYFVLLYFIGCM